jgi:CRISPR-associated protein Cmr1
MHTLTATYRIVTPMFLGDADQKATEIRPPSVKGALRFWWRALNWGRIRERCRNDAEALRELHKEEAELFGAAAEENKSSGQARFLLRAEYTQDKDKKEIVWDRFSGVQYLLGQGLWHFREKLLRPCIFPGLLKLELRLKPISEEQTQQLINALLALGLFGGLGSRSRRGLGSLAIQSIDDKSTGSIWVPNNISELKQAEKRLALRLFENMPPISAFSGHSHLDISLRNDKPFLLLNSIGEEFQLYRSWGNKINPQGIHKVGDRQAEQNFPEDHDGMRQAANGSKPSALPKRSVFGYPHNYFFSSDRAKVDISPKGEGRGRRASPLFIHIHSFPDGSHAALQLLLPATFLPPQDRVELKIKGRQQPFHLNSTAVEWNLIQDYLNRFKQREAIIHAAI